MSPEQATGNVMDLDGKTDQFALAAIAYEMLTGHVVFSGENLAAVLFSILHSEPLPLPGPVRAVLGDSGEAVLRRALSKRREDRFDDVLEFANALQETALWESGARTPRPTPTPLLLNALSASVAAPVAAASNLVLPARPAGLSLTLEIAHARKADELNEATTLSPVVTAGFRSPAAAAPVPRRRHQLVVGALSLLAVAGWATALTHPRRVEDSAERLTAPLLEQAERFKVAARPNQMIYVEVVRPPPGLRATIDGHPASLPIALPRGTAAYRLQLEAPDYQPYETWVDAVADQALELPMLRKPRPDARPTAAPTPATTQR
jgi:hypothetical protein